MSMEPISGRGFPAAVPGPEQLYADCTLCPRACHINRFERSGFCGAGTAPKLARAALHMWEEPCISGEQGSGAVFFSHCTLRCIFCQNHEISAKGFGREVSVSRLAETFLRLQDEGAANINLVTATHFLPSVIRALDEARPGLRIPVVYNCGGYETPETVRMLDGYVDIWLPDMKYSDDALAVRYSSAPGYLETSTEAIRQMIQQAGPPKFGGSPSDDSAGLMKRGVIIRHMVLPGHRRDSIDVLRHIAESFPAGSFLISLLSQYTPFYKALSDREYHSLNRRITSFEYDSVVNEAVALGLKGYMQEKSSAKEEYTPSFDLEGVP